MLRTPELFKAFLSLFVAVALTGCAVSPEFRARYEPAAVGFEEHAGVVMIKAGANKNIGLFFGKWEKLSVTNLSTGKDYVIADSSPPQTRHSLFVQSLPAGTYSLTALSSRSYGTMSNQISGSVDKKYGRFDIVEGRVTDLGTVLFLSPYYPVNSLLYKVVFASVEEESRASIGMLAPKVAASARAGTLGWLALAGSEERPAFIPAKEPPSLFLNDPHTLPDGSMLFGEALGQVARRDPAGKWTYLTTGTINTILSLTSLQDGTIVAGSEQSLLLASQRSGQPWKLIPFPLKAASIRFIGPHPKLGYVVVAQDQRDIVALTTPDLLNPTWTEIGRIPMSMYVNQTQDTRFHAFFAGDRLVVPAVTGGFVLTTELHVLDINTNTWTINKTDFLTRRPEMYVPMDDGTIFAMGGPPISQYFYLSKDGGATWEKRPSPNWSGIPAFRGDQLGFIVRVENLSILNPANSTNAVWKTTDGGRTWSNTGEVPATASHIIMLKKEGEMLLVTLNGFLYFSKDNGAHWEMERGNQ